MHDLLALVTLEALSHFPFKPRSVEDIVSGDLGILPEVELAGGTTACTCQSGTYSGLIIFFF